MAQILVYENGNAIGGEGHPTYARDITFENTGTDLEAETTQAAIVEVNDKTKHGVFEIWTNPNPHSSFAGQNVDVPKNGKTYDAFLILFSDTYNTDLMLAWGTVGDTVYGIVTQILAAQGKIRQFTRPIPITDGGTYYRFAFPDCTLAVINTYGSAAATSTDNAELVPAIIYGIEQQ